MGLFGRRKVEESVSVTERLVPYLDPTVEDDEVAPTPFPLDGIAMVARVVEGRAAGPHSVLTGLRVSTG